MTHLSKAGTVQSDFQSGVDKQKNQLTLDLINESILDLMDQNLALC